MDKIKPFKKLPIAKYFQRDYEKIQMAFRLSGSIHSESGNIRSGGDEIEIAVRNFFAHKLYPKYHVSQGHIVDKTLKTSPQFDIVISEDSKNPVFCIWSDDSEIVYYESVYSYGEIKKSFYKKDLLTKFSDNLGRVKDNLERTLISPDSVECSNISFSIGTRVTELPHRNPLLAFMFFVDSTGLDLDELSADIQTIGNVKMPNYIVFLDLGLILNVDKELYSQGIIKINIYPEFNTDTSVWVLLQWDDCCNILTYQYMLLLEHLNSSIVSIPDLKEYTKNIFDFSITNFHKL